MSALVSLRSGSHLAQQLTTKRVRLKNDRTQFEKAAWKGRSEIKLHCHALFKFGCTGSIRTIPPHRWSRTCSQAQDRQPQAESEEQKSYKANQNAQHLRSVGEYLVHMSHSQHVKGQQLIQEADLQLSQATAQPTDHPSGSRMNDISFKHGIRSILTAAIRAALHVIGMVLAFGAGLKLGWIASEGLGLQPISVSSNLVIMGLAFALLLAYMTATEEVKKWQAYSAKSHTTAQGVVKCNSSKKHGLLKK